MKRINYKSAIILTLVVGLLGVASCKKEFLDVNNNPNAPEKVDVKFALPSAESYLGYTVGNQLALVGGFWGQYWTQGPNANQYASLDQYIYNSADADRPWAALYAGTLKDLQFIYETGTTKDSTKRNYAAIARILQAYTYQVITDAWGDVPFSESLKGDADNVAPHFDSQEAVYDGILDMVDEGMSMLDPNFDSPGSDDLIYNGDLFLWYEFGNTLKLKILLRQSEIRPSLAQTKISEMFTNGEPFIDMGESARLYYADQKFQQSPLYTTGYALGTTSNIFGSSSAIDYLNNTNDPRVADFYAENGSGNFVGLQQGEGKLLGGNQSDGTWSKPNDQLVGPTASTTLISDAESKFLQAEAIVRGWGSGDEQATYEAGIEASWSTWAGSSELVATDLATFLASDSIAYPASGSTADKLKAILTQKWVAMTGNQNFEAWTEFRRTGYPSFLQPSVTSVLGGGAFPARIVYPSDEVTSNTNFPGVKTVTVKVWWDAN
ncbi:MAG: SusD/RagB family nutrient-binding outer membrane lipoprotein [Chitinophagales bacterium]